MKQRKRHSAKIDDENEDPQLPDLPRGMGSLAGFYFCCAPLAALGLLLGGALGFVIAIVANAVFWSLRALIIQRQ